MWIFRIICNYECSNGCFLTTQSILDDARRIGQPINEINLGRVLNRLWGDKIRKLPNDSEKGSGYENLKKRIVQESHSREIDRFTENIVDQIRQLCSIGSGWIVNHSIIEKRVTMLKVPSSKSNATGMTVEGRCLVCEIILALDPPSIVLRTHGEPVFLKDVIGEEFEVSMSLNTIDKAIRLVETESFCVGHIAIPKEGNSDGQVLQVPVTGSKVLNTSTINERGEKRLISTSCMLLAFGTKACKNCVYVGKLWKNREKKRNMKDKGLPHDKCNVRFLATMGLKEKICMQRKELRSDTARQKRMKDEMVEFEESDSVDLKKLFDGIESKDVPPEMKLLWEVQMKQLSVKSSTGFRWHPRLVFNRSQ